MVAWNTLNLLIINFYILELGLIVGWGDRFWRDELRWVLGLNIAFLVVFLVDIFLSPLKAYYENGVLIQNREVIFHRYVRLSLWIDLLGFIGVLVPYLSQSLVSNWFKILFVGKLYTAFELDRYLFMLIRNRFNSSYLFSISRVVYLALLWAHILGVGFFAIDHHIYETNLFGPNTPNHCWIFNSGLGFSIVGEPWYVQYVFTLYYSVGNVTTIAYGDVVSRNWL